MAYNKLNLKDGQVFKAEHLEHIENGIKAIEEALEEGGGGSDGVGISKIEQTTTSSQDGGTNVITVTKTDGTKSTFQIKNGSKGSAGVGIKSVEKTGTNGLVDTYTITFTDNTKTTFTVTNGSSGSGGTGYIPQRGTDYWTAEDIAQIKSYVDDAILGGAW